MPNKQNNEMRPEDILYEVKKYLTPRELEVYSLAVQGLPTKLISSELAISPHTVETHRASIFRKLGVRSVTELQYEYGPSFLLEI